MRASVLWLHRWSGLVIALFLVVVGITGTVLAFHDEIDRALSPQLRVVRPQGTPLPQESLIQIAERRFPNAAIRSMPLHRAADESASIWMIPRLDPLTGRPHPIGFDELVLDPYTGALLGTRASEKLGLGGDRLLETIYQLHFELLAGVWGHWLLGIVAVLWLINCLIGFYLTLPERRRRFFANWKRSWLVRSLASIWRFSFDFHRAAGLWLWGALLVFALSAVQFNMFEPVFRPVVSLVMPLVVVDESIPIQSVAGVAPRLTWDEALARGRELMRANAAQRGFTIDYETFLFLDRQRNAFGYSVHSTLDVRQRGGGDTDVTFSAADGRQLAFSHPHIASGNTLSYWLSALHMARVWGLPYQIFVALMGLVIAALSVTGVLVWFKRRAVVNR